VHLPYCGTSSFSSRVPEPALIVEEHFIAISSEYIGYLGSERFFYYKKYNKSRDIYIYIATLMLSKSMHDNNLPNRFLASWFERSTVKTDIAISISKYVFTGNLRFR